MSKDNLSNDIEALKELVLKQALELDSHKSEIESHKVEIKILREQVEFFKGMKFGTKSEKIPVDQLALFNEFEEAPPEETEKEETAVKEHSRSSKRGKRSKLPDWLPREEVIIDLNDAEKLCSVDGEQLKLIGEEVSEKLDIVPAKIKVIKTIRKKYACSKCEESLKVAPLPVELLPKTIATPGLIAWIATSKYVDGLPLYRIENVSERHGIELKRNTMSRWMITVADKLQPLKKILEEELLSSNYIHCDETTVQVLKEKDKKATTKSYMWVMGRAGPKPIVLYNYSPSRSGEVPKMLFENFSGYLQTDGYSGYTQFKSSERIKLMGCMAHMRRKFHDAWKVGNKKKKSGLAYKVIEKLKDIYKLEEEVKDSSSEERFKLRQSKILPLIDETFELIIEHKEKAPAQSLLGKAITYAINQEKLLRVFLEDGSLSIDNNFIERAIRPFAVGRSAWKFSATTSGADASALWYSLIETAKLNQVEPYEYLRKVLEKLPHAETLEDYLELLPFKVD